MSKHLATVLANVFGLHVADIHPELKKSDVDNWDSLKQMDLVLTLEREYSIVLDIPDILRLGSVADILEVLKEKGVSLEN
jgi:acyl carrier protein